MKNIIVAQSGGPTTAINASLVGVIKGALSSGGYDKVFGSLYGISGVLKEEFIQLENLSDEELHRIYSTPSSYLGSCRYKMPDINEDSSIYEKIFKILNKYEVTAFFYIGGNDSMDTISKLAEYGSSIGSDIRFAGVPKTIDNDLVSTDHTPGYGSAAKFIVASMLEFAHDTSVYKAPTVTLVEIMGRNAGWLTASAALARNEYSDIPQLIYLPEVPFSTDDFIRDIKEVLQSTNNVVVAISEGLQDADGNYLSATKAACDKFGHAQLSGVGKILENLVKEDLGVKCRSVEINILQRCAAHMASAEDLEESELLGEKAVEYAIEGKTGYMTTIVRTSNEPYKYKIEPADLDGIANQVKQVPKEWINSSGNDVTSEMLDYVRPLLCGEVDIEYKNGVPVYADISHLTGVV
ncbi:MAG: 6-phosphofructokinase [Eubacterium sp.]|nr:6-phosphofructokinase [Eubacterium sp.]